MKRRILLLLGTFAALLLAFYGYRLATEVPLPGEPNAATPGAGSFEASAGEAPVGEKFEPPRRGRGVFIVRRDQQHHLRSVYKAERWEKIDEQSYRVEKPDIELWLKGGQRVYILARTGTIRTDGTGENPPTKVALSGDVKIDIDRFTAAQRTPLDERPEDRIRIRMDDVEFDNELLSVKTSSRVTLESAEADIVGRGLKIEWREAPRELELLRIEQGERIVVKRVPADVNLVSLPAGRPAGPEAPAPGAAPARPQPPAATKPVTPRPAAAATGPAPPEERNVYLARVFDNVRVVSGDRLIRGARQMSLQFDWGRGFRDREPTAPPKPGKQREAPRPPSAETERAPRPPAQPPTPKPTTMVVTWTGPLILQPVGRVAKPSGKRFIIRGQAQAEEPAVITDGKTTATCEAFTFRHDDAPADGGPAVEQGTLTAGEDRPVVMALADGSRMVCRGEARFDRLRGEAVLRGPGEMTSPGAGLRGGERGTARAAEAPAATRPAGEVDRITWRDSVVALFKTEEQRGRDGRSVRREVLETATFVGDVRLRRAGTEDFVDCNALTVTMARGREGAAYPAKAFARGNVVAQQGGSDIRADEAVVAFEEAPEEAAPGAARVRPVSVDAAGNVHLTDRRGERVLTATADRLISNLLTRKATLFGRRATSGDGGQLARIALGDNVLWGREINIYEVAGAAGTRELEVRVTGDGRLEFLTQRDLGGRELTEPRQIDLAWTKSMQYFGQRNYADFVGDVELDSATDHVECERMRLWFEELPATTQPASGRAPRAADDRGLGFEMAEYSKRRIREIRGDGGVLLRRREADEQGRLLRRMQVTGEQMEYDTRTGRVLSTGRGTLVAEDYRPPEGGRAATQPSGNGAGASMDVSRPWQMTLEWRDLPATRAGGAVAAQMELLQAERSATATGDVAMRFVSGNRVVLAERLRVPPWGELTVGESIGLSCQKLTVEFLEPSGGGEPQSETFGGVRIGNLRQVSVVRQVYVSIEGKGEATAQRGLYERRARDPQGDRVTLWGSLPGEPAADATLTYRDARRGPQKLSSPKITWLPKGDRAYAEGASVVGGR